MPNQANSANLYGTSLFSSDASKVYVTLGIVLQGDVLEGRKAPAMYLSKMKEKFMTKEVVSTATTENMTWNENLEL